MDLTQPPLLYLVIAVAVVVVGSVLWAVAASARKRRERDALKERYGPEYDRTVAEHRTTRAAVADLKEREAEHDTLHLRDLNDTDRELVRTHMAAAQFRFVEDPADAILRTERIMIEVLRAKGYPVASDREQATRLFSVDHPAHAESLRTLFNSEHGGAADQLRERFLQARKTIQEVTGTTFEVGDVPPLRAMGGDLRVEHGAQDQRESTRTSPA